MSGRLDELEEVYKYQGAQTCAADGMCQVKCPVKINTGEMIKELRAQQYDDGTPSKYAGVSLSARQLVRSVTVPGLKMLGHYVRLTACLDMQDKLGWRAAHAMPCCRRALIRKLQHKCAPNAAADCCAALRRGSPTTLARWPRWCPTS